MTISNAEELYNAVDFNKYCNTDFAASSSRFLNMAVISDTDFRS